MISIITPVYNTEKYLSRCLDSIIAQTYQDWELFLIDDGSKDSSGSICDVYAQKDTRIKVVHQVNGGVSSARNKGLELATGEWVAFIDADDYVSPEYLSQLVAPTLSHSDIDLVHCGALKTIDGKISETFFTKDAVVDTDFKYLVNHFEGYPFSKLFKLAIIEGDGTYPKIRFDVHIKVCEDMVFTLEYLQHITDRYAFIPDNGYLYTSDNEQSAMHQGQRKRNEESSRRMSLRLLPAYETALRNHSLTYDDAPVLSKWVAQCVTSSLFYPYKIKATRRERLDSVRAEWENQDTHVLDFCKPDRVRRMLYRLLQKRRYLMFDIATSALALIWKKKS